MRYKSIGNLFRSKRDFELNKATYDTEVNTAKAEAEMAYGLQEAKVRSKIKEEEMQVMTNLHLKYSCNSFFR